MLEGEQRREQPVPTVVACCQDHLHFLYGKLATLAEAVNLTGLPLKKNTTQRGYYSDMKKHIHLYKELLPSTEHLHWKKLIYLF